MKRLIYLLLPVVVFASCGESKKDPAAELVKLKKERADLDAKIAKLESGKKDSVKVSPVSVYTVEVKKFNAFIEVHSMINGDEDVLAVPQGMGTVNSLSVRTGDRVSKGQVLATLDANIVEKQIDGLAPQLSLTKSLYEKQQSLFSQNIGTEVQLMSAKAQYEGIQKQIEALKAQKDLYRIVAPISGTVDAVNLKVGDFASPQGAAAGIGVKIVSYAKLKAEANLGENYLGNVKQGDPVTLTMPGSTDTIKTTLSFVSHAVDPTTRAFNVMVRLGNNNKLHPNMSCTMQIANYENAKAMVVPVSVIQKTSSGERLYIADGNKAKLVAVTTGKIANGQVEILSGLSVGDKVITVGYEAMEDGQAISIQ